MKLSIRLWSSVVFCGKLALYMLSANHCAYQLVHNRSGTLLLHAVTWSRETVLVRCGMTSVGGLMQGPAGPMFNEASKVPVNGWCPCVMAVTSLLNARAMSTSLASVVGAVPAGCHCMCSGGEALEKALAPVFSPASTSMVSVEF